MTIQRENSHLLQLHRIKTNLKEIKLMKKLKKKVLLIYLIKNRIPDIYRLQKTQKTIIHFFDDAYDSFSELLENLIGLKFILEVILNKILFIDILVTPSKPPSKKNNFQKKLTY